MYYIILLYLWHVSLLGIASTTPVVRRSLNPKLIRIRSPITNEAFADDWPTNVVMIGGSQTYGMWIPTDGVVYDLGTIRCLGLPAYAIGDCNDMTVDKVGVVAGNGPCNFEGWSGWKETIQGVAGEGYYTVGPPQNMKSAQCGV
jgi:hypothetical protein